MNFYFATHLLYVVKVSNICSKKKHFFVFFYLFYTYFFHIFSFFVYFLFLCTSTFILIFTFNVYFYHLFRPINTSVFWTTTITKKTIYFEYTLSKYMVFYYYQSLFQISIICCIFLFRIINYS